jgi:hypothetical protein
MAILFLLGPSLWESGEDVPMRTRREIGKPRIRARDRVLFALAVRMFGEVVHAVAIVRPETVVRWHRSFWRLIWRRKSGRPVGRPPADADLRAGRLHHEYSARVA